MTVNSLLTEVILRIAKVKLKNNEYGILLKDLPEFNYVDFLNKLNECFTTQSLHALFIGFNDNEIITMGLGHIQNENIESFFTVEDAEESRNHGNEDILRILIVRREVPKFTSLKWFEAIAVDSIYKELCVYAKECIGNPYQTNKAISNLIQVLSRKEIRQLVSLERILDYFSCLFSYEISQLPIAVVDEMYRLGLCRDKHLLGGFENLDGLRKRLIRNSDIVYEIGVLENNTRKNIRKHAAKADKAKITANILKYYEYKDIAILKDLELTEVEDCLKEVKNDELNNKAKKGGNSGTKSRKPDSFGASLVIDKNQNKIKETLRQIQEKIEEQEENHKRGNIEVKIDNDKIIIKNEPSINMLSNTFVEESRENEQEVELILGGIIKAEVENPADALIEINKYEVFKFGNDLLSKINEKLSEFDQQLGNTVLFKYFNSFIQARKLITNNVERLKDCPILVVSVEDNFNKFKTYIDNYAKLLCYLNDNFPAMWALDSSEAKEVVSSILSLDMTYVIGMKSLHAIPTPMNPLYLWKYVELAREIMEGTSELSDQDKEFIIRKANEIPDPISTTLITAYITGREAVYLPIAGKIGNLPFYSSEQQVDHAEDGAEELRKAIVKYIKLYPHSGINLRLSVINPPSVQFTIETIKSIYNDKDVELDGLNLNIYRTKETDRSWVEVDDSAFSEGLINKFKLGESNKYRVTIHNKRFDYNKLLDKLNSKQHAIVIFDPNEKTVDVAKNDPLLQIHPLCIPKAYEYKPISGKVEIRPTNEGGLFSDFTKLNEKLNDRPAQYNQHTSLFYNSPLEEDTYRDLLKRTDWLIILDQMLRIWDVGLKANSEKLYYHNADYRDIGIYSLDKRKLVLGFMQALQKMGNFAPHEKGINGVIESIRRLNEQGLLSLASFSRTEIFNERHAKGALGIAVAARCYQASNTENILVGLDTELARRWLDEREEGQLPDLVGIDINSEDFAYIDIIEVKTHKGDFSIDEETLTIKGKAVEQVESLEGIMDEIFNERTRITTTSRREILRTQIFEALFQANLSKEKKRDFNQRLNKLFAGGMKTIVRKVICYVDFEAVGATKTVMLNDNSIGYIAIDKTLVDSIISENTYIDDAEKLKIFELLFKLNFKNYSFLQDDKATNEVEDIQNQNNINGNVTSFSNQTIGSESNGSMKEVTSESNQRDIKASDMDEEIVTLSKRLTKSLRDFAISSNEVNPALAQRAARFIRFRIELRSGETLSKVLKYKADISRELEAEGEILVDNERGTRYVRVDVPFRSEKPIKLLEHLDDLLVENKPSELRIIAGQAPNGTLEKIDIGKAPHILTAGATGSGKTIFLYSLIVSLIHQYGPDKLELIIIDPKQTDFIFFNNLPHLRYGEVITDAEAALNALLAVVEEDIDLRTNMLKSSLSRDIISHNEKSPENPMKPLVIVIDEYADLIQVAEILGKRKDFEQSLMRLAQRVRNLGIHLIIATQRPSANIVTPVLKANMPFRISFRLPAHQDSMTILDRPGAEDLLGKGDMLLINEGDIRRLQGLFISESELIEYLNNYNR